MSKAELEFIYNHLQDEWLEENGNFPNRENEMNEYSQSDLNAAKEYAKDRLRYLAEEVINNN